MAQIDPREGPLTEEETAMVEFIKGKYDDVLLALRNLADSREKSLAITHLEDSCMRATRAVITAGGIRKVE